MKFHLLILFLFGLCFISCDNLKKDDQLKEREMNLLKREKEFATKKQDYETLKVLRDSLENAAESTSLDSIITNPIPDDVIGKWNGKMICTESTCPENVIGDQRNDIWIFSKQNLTIINKSGGERSYKAKFTGSEIKLNSENTTSNPNKSEITLQFPNETIGRIKGNRELIGTNCISKFSVELEKIKE